MADENFKTFDRRMREATKEIHSISDELVNAKLAFGISNKDVWTEGLLVFYEIFHFLEEAVTRNPGSILEEVFIEDMKRTQAFEDDLKYYLGSSWKSNYTVRESVRFYLEHLEKLEKEEPTLLIAYIYHLYMGLLSGGQIIRFKRGLASRIGINKKSTAGDSVTDFGQMSISTLKKRLRDNLNRVAEGFSEDLEKKLLDESKIVFALNNQIIKSVKSINRVVKKKIFVTVLLAIITFYLYYCLFQSDKSVP